MTGVEKFDTLVNSFPSKVCTVKSHNDDDVQLFRFLAKFAPNEYVQKIIFRATAGSIYFVYLYVSCICVLCQVLYVATELSWSLNVRLR